MRSNSARWRRSSAVAARFFVDENDLALGKSLAEQHGDVVFPGHEDLPEVPRVRSTTTGCQ